MCGYKKAIDIAKNGCSDCYKTARLYLKMVDSIYNASSCKEIMMMEKLFLGNRQGEKETETLKIYYFNYTLSARAQQS